MVKVKCLSTNCQVEVEEESRSDAITWLQMHFVVTHVGETQGGRGSRRKKMERPEIMEEAMAATWNMFEDDWE